MMSSGGEKPPSTSDNLFMEVPEQKPFITNDYANGVTPTQSNTPQQQQSTAYYPHPAHSAAAAVSPYFYHHQNHFSTTSIGNGYGPSQASSFLYAPPSSSPESKRILNCFFVLHFLKFHVVEAA